MICFDEGCDVVWFYGTVIPDNSIGVEGAKALVPALKSLSQLTSLNLSGE